MGDQEKEAGFRGQPTEAGTASDGSPDTQDAGSDGVRAEAQRRGRTIGAAHTLSEITRNRLAVQLRAMYETVAQQPVPDRFAELIAQLDGGDSGQS